MIISSRPSKNQKQLDAMNEAIADLTAMAMIVTEMPDDLITAQARELIAKAARRVANDLSNAI